MNARFLIRLFLLALSCIPATKASVIVLTFEGLRDLERILQYYNGGFGDLGSGPGPNYGIVFGSSALAIIDEDAGGRGNFANEPSPNTTAFFLSGPGVVMNVPAGFTNGFSFFYSAVDFPGTVTVWDGLNGTGNLLATLTLPPLGSGCGGDPRGDFNCWAPIGAAFSGIARSVNFSGSANAIGFDDITLGSRIPGNPPPAPAPIPEPGTMGLLGLGLMGMRLRHRAARRSASRE